jgi:Fe-S cluster assembly protein SufD
VSTLELPSPKSERWRWADLRALQRAAESPRDAAPDLESALLPIDGPRLVFVDGVYDAARSAPGPVAVGSRAWTSEHPLARFAAGEGWALELGQEAVTDPIQIVHLGSGGGNHLRGSIVLAADAAASVVETFVGSGWANRQTRIELSRGARLMRSVRLIQADGFVSIRDEVDVGQAASYAATFLGAGGMSSRIDGELVVSGTDAYAEMGGALLTRGEQRQECAVTVRHAAERGTSHQTWRAVAADQSAASLAARVDVARGAQKTDGEQSLRGILLQRTATVNLKPELEIFADDVKCAHGATVGELDNRALFYLQSRGVPRARAKALLTRAFVADSLDRIGQEAVREAFVADADHWLEAAL